MTLQELRDELTRAYPSATDTTLIDAAINWAYREAAKLWTPKKRTTTAITLVAGQYRYDLSADCWLVAEVWLDDKQLTPTTPERLTADYPTWRTDSGTPQWFYVDRQDMTAATGGKIVFALPPDSSAAAKTVELAYGYIPAKMTQNEDVPILPVHLHDALWIGGAFRYAQVNEDATGLQVFTPWWNAQKAELAEDSRQSHARTSRARGRQVRPWLGVR